MDDNLESQYDKVLTSIEQYQLFEMNIMRRFLKPGNPSAKRAYKLMNKYSLQQMKPLSGRTPKWYQQAVTEVTTPEEKETNYFQILVNDYHTNSFSTYLLTRFPEFDFERLKRLHDLKKENLTRINYMQAAGGVLLAIATL